MSALGAVFRRDLRLAWAGGGGAAMPLAFLAGATTLLPFALGSERDVLEPLGAPLVWITLALAVLTSLERLFRADVEDGTLDQLLMAPVPLEAIAAAKGAALWVANGLPLAAAGGLLALMLQVPPAAAVLVGLSLAIGAMAFIGFGLVGAAVAAGVSRGGLLVALIVLPFYAPPVIFGAATAQAMAMGEPFVGPLALLAGISLGAAALGPIAAAAALRVQAD